jgi:hypothetical protein
MQWWTITYENFRTGVVIKTEAVQARKRSDMLSRAEDTAYNLVGNDTESVRVVAVPA